MTAGLPPPSIMAAQKFKLVLRNTQICAKNAQSFDFTRESTFHVTAEMFFRLPFSINLIDIIVPLRVNVRLSSFYPKTRYNQLEGSRNVNFV